jgi:predicted RNA-binding protein with PIN domain
MYLLDGNNIMGQRVGWHRDKPGARRRLIDELQRVAELLDTNMAVVFDAPRGGAMQRFGRLEVYYAHERETADDRIVDLARQLHGESSLIAVTSDRDLALRLAQFGVEVTPSGAFRRLIDSYHFPSPGSDPQ